MSPIKRKVVLMLLLTAGLPLGGAGPRAFQPSDKSRPAKAVAILPAKPLFSPDGKWMVLVDYDLKRWISEEGVSGCAHTLHLRETASGKDRWTVERAGPFGPMVFSPNSKTLAVGKADTIQLREAVTGKTSRSLTAKRLQGQRAQVVVDLAFAPNGKTLVAVSQEVPLPRLTPSFVPPPSLFTFWNVANGKVLQQRQGRSGHGYGLVRFLPDGKVVAWEGKNRLVELRSGRLLFLALGANPNWDPFLSPDGKTCFWNSEKYGDYSIHRGDVTREKELPSLEGHPGTLVAVDFSSDGQTVATAGGNTVCLWDETGKTSHILRGHANAVHTIAFSPDGKTLASGGYDGKVFLWETATGKVRARFHGHRGWVQSVYFSPDGRLLVSAGAFHDAKRQVAEETYLWDVTGRYQDGRLKEARFSSSELSGLWSGLAGEDAAMAYRAVWALVAAPQQSIALLRARLIPADDKQIVRWIAELDSEEFKVREQAHKALEKQGETAEFALRAALRETSSVEVRRRLRELLEKQAHASLSPKALQELRAVEVLEHLGTLEARRLLASLAKGTPHARLTHEAQAALHRLR